MTRIEFAGDLDDGCTESIRDAVRDALVEPAAPTIVLDLGEVTYLDTEAVGCVVAAVEKARRVGVQATIIPGRHVRHSLEHHGLRYLFDE